MTDAELHQHILVWGSNGIVELTMHGRTYTLTVEIAERLREFLEIAILKANSRAAGVEA